MQARRSTLGHCEDFRLALKFTNVERFNRLGSQLATTVWESFIHCTSRTFYNILLVLEFLDFVTLLHMKKQNQRASGNSGWGAAVFGVFARRLFLYLQHYLLED